MIEYTVNEEKKQIKCTISGEELKLGCIKLIKKAMQRTGCTFDVNLNNFELKDNYIGIATYNKEETEEFSICKGKELARKKAFLKYNRDMFKNLKRFKSQVNFLNEELLVLQFEREFIVKDINDSVLRY